MTPLVIASFQGPNETGQAMRIASMFDFRHNHVFFAIKSVAI